MTKADAVYDLFVKNETVTVAMINQTLGKNYAPQVVNVLRSRGHRIESIRSDLPGEKRSVVAYKNLDYKAATEQSPKAVSRKSSANSKQLNK